MRCSITNRKYLHLHMLQEHPLTRYSLILKWLVQGPAGFTSILRSLEAHYGETTDLRVYNLSHFQRDCKEMQRLFGIQIDSEIGAEEAFYIKNPSRAMNYLIRLLEDYQVIEALHLANDPYLFPELRPSYGMDHFNLLLQAVREKRIVQFHYHKFWEQKVNQRIVHPLGLKESKGSWYLVGVDQKDSNLKTFGLDRMREIEVSKNRFRQEYTFQIDGLFQDSFGIMMPNNGLPQTVRLQFNYERGQYVKAYPIHHSQKLIAETDASVTIEVHVYITYDFVRELLSYGNEVVVASPVILINEVKRSLEKALAGYGEG